MSPAAIDAFLAHHFRPVPVPDDLARRIVRSAGRRESDLARLAESLAVEATERGVVRVHPGRLTPTLGHRARRLADRAREELFEFFSGRRAYFSVPVDLSEVPPFRRRVLRAARLIPFGEARPYAWVAGRIGHPRAVRAVGTALGRNPVPLIVPCHRVLRSDGSLGGYGLGTGLKARLLDLERHTPVLEGNSATKFICRLGCDATRGTRPDRRVVFASVADARTVGYRPCEICLPREAR